MKLSPILLRLLFHALLAAFLANAANKFFTAELDAEMSKHFYGRIFEGHGDAPDQYRILPLLPLKLLCIRLPFNTAVLVYNSVLAFACFELMWLLMRGIREQKKYAFMALFAGAYIYSQYTGWRPDTMGLYFLACLTVLAGTLPRERIYREAGLLAGIAALSFARTDIALAFAAFYAVYHVRTLLLRLLLPLVPIAVQVLLKFAVYPEARYYSKVLMLWDNLSLYYFIRNPASYLILAALIAFWKPLLRFGRWCFQKYPLIFAVLGAYLVLVLFVGRVNEYRLYLPFIPILLSLWRERTCSHEKETGPV